MTEAIQPTRVSATPAALELIARLKAQHGDIMFHQTGGGCAGSAPPCLLCGELSIGRIDFQLGLVAG